MTIQIYKTNNPNEYYEIRDGPNEFLVRLVLSVINCIYSQVAG